jgi:hypothetical protein
MNLRPWFLVCGLAVWNGCAETREIGLDPILEPTDETAKVSISGVRVAVVAHTPVATAAPVAEKGGTQPDPAPKQDRSTVVQFTPQYREKYASLKVLRETVPAALKELGFVPVPAKTAAEAATLGAQLVVELQTPEVEGFRRATGVGISLEGTVYDVHVTERAALRTADGTLLGHVSGHGQSVTTFRFEDPYLELAVVGAVSVALMGVVTVGLAIPLGYVLWMRRDAAEPVPGVCRSDQLSDLPSADGSNRLALCGKATWIMAQVAALSVLAGAAGGVLVLSRFVAARVFDGITGGIKRFLAEGMWRDMVKTSHDRAARSLAVGIARVWMERNAPGAPGVPRVDP